MKNHIAFKVVLRPDYHHSIQFYFEAHQDFQRTAKNHIAI